MKEWWMNLNLRQKKLIFIGAIAVILFLLYELIWAPLSNINDSLRNEIIHNQKLLAYMQEADQRIITMEKLSKKTSSSQSSAALLNLLQKEVNQSPFAKNVMQLKQSENNSVQITFLKVNFDSFIQWLIQLWQKQGITVMQMTVTPNGALGMVDANVVLM